MKDSSPSTLTQWPSYDITSQQYIRLRANLFTIESHFVADRVHFWNSLAPVLVDECEAIDCAQCDGHTTIGGSSFPQALFGLIYVLVIIQVL